MTIQLTAWFHQPLPELAMAVLATLKQHGFHVGEVTKNERFDGGFYGWDFVTIDRHKVWCCLRSHFHDCQFEIKTQTAGRSKMFEFVSLFEGLVQRYPTLLECVLSRTNGDHFPTFAYGLRLNGVVNCDTDPPIETRPGMPNYWRELGAQSLYVSHAQFAAAMPNMTPAQWAHANHATATQLPSGILFDCGWREHVEGVRRFCPFPRLQKSRSAGVL
ncbi:MAG TPA: hypothetical protein PLF40_18175 [Kofleriaceae bacterium]|nr:hypothetical protein [Kofleriaceae bacterium]